MLRIKQLIPVVLPFVTVHWCEENVASILERDKASFVFISTSLQVRPTLLCPEPIAGVRRPRMFWHNWQVRATVEVCLRSSADYQELLLNAEVRLSERAQKQGVQRADGEPLHDFCTFVRASPRAKEPSAPAGWHTCDAATLQRWQEDAYKYPPYQYKLNFLVIPSQLRPPNSELREFSGSK